MTFPRLVAFVLAMLVSWGAAWSVSVKGGTAGSQSSAGLAWEPLITIAVTVGVLMVYRRFERHHVLDGRAALVAIAALVGVITFGRFNPIQQAHVIFDIPPSARQEQWRELARQNPNGWLAIPGTYGALLNGAGIPSITHTLMAPQLKFFRAVFPDMDPAAFDETFNRYGHVMLTPSSTPRALHVDIMGVPIEAFTRPQPAARAVSGFGEP